MKFFLDTADLTEIEKAFELGIMDGVTTNPALLSKQSLSYKEGVMKIVELTKGATVFAEVDVYKRQRLKPFSRPKVSQVMP